MRSSTGLGLTNYTFRSDTFLEMSIKFSGSRCTPHDGTHRHHANCTTPGKTLRGSSLRLPGTIFLTVGRPQRWPWRSNQAGYERKCFLRCRCRGDNEPERMAGHRSHPPPPPRMRLREASVLGSGVVSRRRTALEVTRINHYFPRGVPPHCLGGMIPPRQW